MVIIFQTKPSILAVSAVVGPLERRSVFHSYFDKVLDDERLQKKTNERGNAKLIMEACNIVMDKAHVEHLDVDYLLAGDLINQMTPTNFAARELAISFIGLFSACATSVSSTIIAALLTELGASELAIAGASSQHNTVERQFRYPVDYGAQKPETAQWTVTAAGFALIGKHQQKKPSIAAATVGKVIDFGATDPFHMGGAMAPAAFETIGRHLASRKQKITDYDVIMTGDLGKIGFKILLAMFAQEGISRESLAIFRDAGAEFYGEDTAFQAGASGAGCSAAVYFSYLHAQFLSGRYKRALLVATGALLSPLSYQQGQTIPCTAHAVEIVME